jgi:endonuclease-8
VPEGHTLHLLARDLRRDLTGPAVAVSSPQGRAASLAARVDGRGLASAWAHGKHLFVAFDGVPDEVHVHLGLFGKFTPRPTPPPPAGPNVRLRLSGPASTWDLTGPTACELLAPDEVERMVARLGPDPLRRGASPELAWERLRRKRSATIGQVLMDQSVFAGVGNVFRAEALFVHGIHPSRPATSLTRDEFDALWTTVQSMLRQAMRDRRIVTVARAELERPKSRLRKGEGRYVYKQDVCRRCGTDVRRWDLAGRWAYACETCQAI